MPARVDKLRVPKEHDKRRKLTDEDKERIVSIREKEGLSHRELAVMFDVSRRSIQFILDPQKRLDNVQRRRDRKADYYVKEVHREQQRNHRAHKEAIHFPKE